MVCSIGQPLTGECQNGEWSKVDRHYIFSIVLIVNRMDSTLVDPFKKWEIYDQRTRPEKTDINYAAGKTKQVAWYTDVCETYNNRMAYVLELAKFIQVTLTLHSL